MLKIKDIISMLKDLYKSNLMLENFFDVLLTISAFSFCCNFLSKVGLTFVLASGVLYLLDTATGLVLLTLFAPSILVLINLPIAYVRNLTKAIKKHNLEKVNLNEIKAISHPIKIVEKNYNYNNNLSGYKERNMVRVRKK